MTLLLLPTATCTLCSAPCPMDKLLREPVLIYYVETLPRLKSVQISLFTACHKLSLSKGSIQIAEAGSRQDGKTECFLSPCELDLTSHSHVQLASGILSMKFKPLISTQSVAPPSDVLGRCDIESSSSLSLSCGFCSSRLTRPDK